MSTKIHKIQQEKVNEAILDEIQFWSRMKKNRFCGELPLQEDRPLCRVFSGVLCKGCPIKSFTGVPFCSKTPFNEAQKSFFKDADDLWKQVAQEEIHFLRQVGGTVR